MFNLIDGPDPYIIYVILVYDENGDFLFSSERPHLDGEASKSAKYLADFYNERLTEVEMLSRQSWITRLINYFYPILKWKEKTAVVLEWKVYEDWIYKYEVVYNPHNKEVKLSSEEWQEVENNAREYIAYRYELY